MRSAWLAHQFTQGSDDMKDTQDYFDNWIVQVRKGVLEYCILNTLYMQERYGYDIVKTLVGLPGLGVTEGTIYPLLSRLRVQKLVTTRLEESSEGPVRKYYALTTKGKDTVESMEEHLTRLVQQSRQLRNLGD